jgi:ABC-2 type transport system permease protein
MKRRKTDMTLFLHELRRGRLSLIIWTLAVSYLLAITIILYPEMKTQMSEMNDMFANMGNFTAAFGMDKLNFGEFMGYLGIECSNQLGLGGALFAAIMGISALSKEERDKTAEFLLSHPVSRTKIVLCKYLALLLQVTIFTAGIALFTAISVLIIGETVEVGAIVLLFFAYLLLMYEIASITFGIPAFIGKGGMAIGLGVALLLYFMGIISNITKEVEFLKYFTPFAYTDTNKIINDLVIEPRYLAVGAVLTAIGIAAAFIKYTKKDIA